MTAFFSGKPKTRRKQFFKTYGRFFENNKKRENKNLYTVTRWTFPLNLISRTSWYLSLVTKISSNLRVIFAVRYGCMKLDKHALKSLAVDSSLIFVFISFFHELEDFVRSKIWIYNIRENKFQTRSWRPWLCRSSHVAACLILLTRHTPCICIFGPATWKITFHRNLSCVSLAFPPQVRYWLTYKQKLMQIKILHSRKWSMSISP